MRILVEPSDYLLRNMGDIAMLRTAICRLRSLWPNACTHVLTDDDRLQSLCPGAIPLSSRGRQLWLNNNYLPFRVEACVSAGFPVWFRHQAPTLVERLWCHKLRRHFQSVGTTDLKEFVSVIRQADLVVVAGMGGITDAFPEYAMDLLETLGLAIGRRKYVAMVSQGFGPIRSPALMKAARVVLPKINFIALREELNSRPLLESLGVAPQRLMTTGDDAIEIAYRLRSGRLGNGLGVNLRCAYYSEVDRGLLDQIWEVIADLAEAHGMPIIPVPISNVPGEADIETFQRLTNQESFGGVRLETPEAVVVQIQRCRLVITGSYHAAVFALGSGIPAIGLAKSAYYTNKFTGLAALFGVGCETILLSDIEFATKLKRTAERLWLAADHLRTPLMAQAAQQIKLGHQAYARLKAEVGHL
jgi:colanic acid/amylovoran biosynthesis protein